MANDCIPLYRPGHDVSVYAVTPVVGSTFVEADGLRNALPTVKTCPAGNKPFGVAARDSDPKTTRVAVLRGPNLVIPVTAGVAIAAGDWIEVGAGGKAAKGTRASAVARALSAAGPGEPVFIDLF